MKRFCDDPTIFRTEKITRGHPSEQCNYFASFSQQVSLKKGQPVFWKILVENVAIIR